MSKKNDKKKAEQGPAAAADSQPAASQLEACQAQLAACQAQLAEANDKLLRAKADFENYRKRVQRDLLEARDYVKGATVQEFFSVFDHFQMAMAHMEESGDVQSVKQGMAMILADFRRAFDSLGLLVVDGAGQPFSPDCHEAVAQEPSAEVPAGTILRQWKCGFKCGERLLRPASVVVSSGVPAAPQPEQAE